MFELCNDTLRVHVLGPGEAPNNTFRFDRAGFVSDVIYKGSHYFCASEPNTLIHPSSGGRGFCSEFQMDVSAEAAAGEYFPKPGIGLLKKTGEEPYCFFKKYDCIPYEIAVTPGEDRVRFETLPMECLGYAAKQVKEVILSGSRMILSMQMTNTGEKDMPIREYCHNFISIGGMAIGPDYELLLHGASGIPEGPLPNTRGADNYEGFTENGCSAIRIRSYSSTFAMTQLRQEQIKSDAPFSWTMRHLGDKAFVSCLESFVPAQIAVWSVDHIMSPEVFHEFVLAPGETINWSRTYTFGEL